MDINILKYIKMDDDSGQPYDLGNPQQLAIDVIVSFFWHVTYLIPPKKHMHLGRDQKVFLFWRH